MESIEPNFKVDFETPIKTKLKDKKLIDDVTGGDILFTPISYENFELITNILTQPSEVWLTSAKTKSNRLAYIQNFIKAFDIDGEVKKVVIQVDSVGNYLKTIIGNINQFRRGYLIYEKEEI